MTTPKEPERELVVYDFDPRNLSPEYLQAIGLVVAASAQTESVMQNFIGVLLGIDDMDTLAVTTYMGAPLKDQVARTLTELKAPHVEAVDEIDDLLDAIKDAWEKRNVIVHNALVIHPETREILSHRLKARGSLQLELKPIAVEEIQAAATQIYEVGMDLMRFMMASGLGPNFRTQPLREPLNRGKKARAERRAGRDGPTAGDNDKPTVKPP